MEYVFFVIWTIGMWGFGLPFLFSASNDFLVVGGVLGIIVYGLSAVWFYKRKIKEIKKWVSKLVQ